jgi:hypothetical protein
MICTLRERTFAMMTMQNKSANKNRSREKNGERKREVNKMEKW